MEYQCVYLDPAYNLGHDDNTEVLFESDSLGECCSFVFNKFKEEMRDIAVYQPRSGAYRELYRNKRRDPSGRFS